MNFYAQLDRYKAVLRQLWLLELAYPSLRELSERWSRKPETKPTHLSFEARYILSTYRQLCHETHTTRERLLTTHAAMWLAAADGEAHYLWQTERTALHQTRETWAPAVAEFAYQGLAVERAA